MQTQIIVSGYNESLRVDIDETITTPYERTKTINQVLSNFQTHFTHTLNLARNQTYIFFEVE